MYILSEVFMNHDGWTGESGILGIDAPDFDKAKQIVYSKMKLTKHTHLHVSEDNDEILAYQIEHGDSGISVFSQMKNKHLEIIK